MPRFMVLSGRPLFPSLPDDSSASLRPALAFPLLFGILLGTILGVFSETLPASLNSSAFFSETGNSVRIGAAIWRAVRYPIFALLLSTGYLGVFLLPVLTAFRGFSYACSVSALFGNDGFSGLLFALISIGLPAFAELSCFLFVGGRCLNASYSLLPSRRRALTERITGFRLREILLVAALCSARVIYCVFFLPLLTEWLF